MRVGEEARKVTNRRSASISRFHLILFLRQMADRLAPKHRRQLTAWQVFMSSREEISQLGIEPPTSSMRFGFISPPSLVV